MSQLTSLPSEIFVAVLRNIGSKDIWNTLTVSKYWYQVAEPICYEHVTLILSAPKTEDYLGSTKSQNLLKMALRILNVTFPGIITDKFDPTDWGLLMMLMHLEHLLPSFDKLTSFNFHFRFDVLAWESREFAILDENSKSYFVDNPSPYISDHRVEAERGVLHMIDSLVRVTSLSFLELDLSGTISIAQVDNKDHICPVIAQLIPRLQHLRLRLPIICPELLADLSDASYELAIPSLLKTVIINTVHMHNDAWSRDTKTMKTTHHCDSAVRESGERLCATLRLAFEADSMRMPDLQYLRLIWHNLTTHEIFALDAVTGRKAKLSRVGWDEYRDVDWEEHEKNVKDKDGIFSK